MYRSSSSSSGSSAAGASAAGGPGSDGVGNAGGGKGAAAASASAATLLAGGMDSGAAAKERPQLGPQTSGGAIGGGGISRVGAFPGPSRQPKVPTQFPSWLTQARDAHRCFCKPLNDTPHALTAITHLLQAACQPALNSPAQLTAGRIAWSGLRLSCCGSLPGTP